MSKEQRKEIKEAFELFDSEKKGKIEYNEVKIILKALGFQIEKSELIQLMKQYDPQQTGEIEYLDYVDLSISNK